ncbi:hypothetical protein BS50DRAFT_573956 [Corynespora cassiicola Philippines]|uniref:Uncharacterized protein n=1 Tax=Corynespora cassiicola Philippines TaxID=1448308 RepID=A0A2T2NP61_CORCC|nr:hypothetical protein BS50DRAFT_573956 [Corynespora cassiicola Philippines]
MALVPCLSCAPPPAYPRVHPSKTWIGPSPVRSQKQRKEPVQRAASSLLTYMH